MPDSLGSAFNVHDVAFVTSGTYEDTKALPDVQFEKLNSWSVILVYV